MGASGNSKSPLSDSKEGIKKSRSVDSIMLSVNGRNPSGASSDIVIEHQWFGAEPIPNIGNRAASFEHEAKLSVQSLPTTTVGGYTPRTTEAEVYAHDDLVVLRCIVSKYWRTVVNNSL